MRPSLLENLRLMQHCVGADVGVACRRLDYRHLPRIRRKPASANLQIHGVIVGEFIARQILDTRVVDELLLERQMPVQVPLAPAQILQPSPELVRLLDPADFLAARRL